MPSSTFTQNMGIYIAKQVKSSVATTSNVYLAISRVDAWANDAFPDVANSSQASINTFRRNMIGGKRIAGGDVSHVIPRKNWVSGSVVQPHSITRTSLLSSANLPYVMTEDYNVYKCILNNNGGTSTIKPVSTNPNTTYSTADGYIWKYMYTLSDVDRIKFTTTDWMPVKTLASNDGSLQWRVQQAAVPGAIAAIRVVSGGSGYNVLAAPAVTISGDGTAAAATANVTAANTIDKIIITSAGSGYTYANVSFASGSATAVAEIGPPGGHGADPLTELAGHYLMFNARIRGSEDGKITVSNDFRTLGLLADPYTYGTSNAFSATAFNQTQVITVSGTGAAYSLDETVYQGASIATSTFSGDLVDYDTANNVMRVANIVGTPTSGPLIGLDTAASRFVTAVADPDLSPYSGKILYIDNIQPIVRNVSQTEDIKIVVSFQF